MSKTLAARYRIRFISCYRRSRSSTLRAFVFFLNANASGNSDEHDLDMASPALRVSQKMANLAKLKASFGSFDLLPFFFELRID